jgi:ammonia channel protein AmtB
MIFFIALVFVITTAIPLFLVFIGRGDDFALFTIVLVVIVVVVVVVFPSIGLELQFNDRMTNITIGCESDFLENIIVENSRRKSFFVYFELEVRRENKKVMKVRRERVENFSTEK